MNFKLEKAEKELYNFLEENPELISMQDHLNKSMDKVEPQNRMKVLSFYIQDNLEQLKVQLIMLQMRVDGLSKELEEK